jgi:serine/threonine protein kinase
VLNTDWQMMREINEGLEEESNAQYMSNFSEIYSVRDLLGVGAFGVVLLVKNRITNEKSALKIINKETLSSRALNILKNESKIMKSLHHPSVVGFKRIYENERFMMIEMEFVCGGQLKRLYK